MISASPLPATEAVDPRFEGLDGWPSIHRLEAMWEGQLAAAAAVRSALPALALAATAAAGRLSAGGRLAYAGAGTSGRIGVQDGAELPPTFDWPAERVLFLLAGGADAFTRSIENAEDDVAAAEAEVARLALGPPDVIIGVAASGSTPFTIAAIRAARARGALTIGVANSPAGALLAAADHAILIETGPEVLAGSTRMKAGTAQKIALNLLSTDLMIALGRVHRGLMVDMQARNAKLRDRAMRMLRALTGRPDDDLRAALAASEGRVKTAVLILHGLDRMAAERLLAVHAGHLRAALASLGA
jgi:N-acetylmuramic acid 6-phosphate etherase